MAMNNPNKFVISLSEEGVLRRDEKEYPGAQDYG